MRHTRRRDKYANPSERVRFGSMRYLPPFLSNANPNIFHGAANGIQNDVPLPASYQSQNVWATFLAGNGGDTPSWVLSDTTVVPFVAPNIETGVFGDTPAIIKAWSIVVPANAVAVRIGIGAPHVAALVMWKMASLNSAAMGNGSALNSPQGFVPAAPRSQAYVIAACVGQVPHMSSVPGFDMGVVLPNGDIGILGATNNTINVVFPCTYTAQTKLGFYQWCTDSKPPIL